MTTSEPDSIPQTKKERRRLQAMAKFVRLLSMGLRVQRQKITALDNQVLSLQDAVADLRDELAQLRQQLVADAQLQTDYYAKLRRSSRETEVIPIVIDDLDDDDATYRKPQHYEPRN